MRRLDPRGAAYLVAGIIALSFSYDLMRVPIQTSDSLEQLLNVQQSPSVYATFAATAERGAYLRPMFLAEIDVLFDLAQGHYWLVYRGFHALLLFAAVLLFIRALQVRTWEDFAAAVFALTVLTGLHTFRGTVREAFPTSHFLQVVVLCLLALNLAQGRSASADRHRWWIDVAAAITFAVASLTLESGLLVWVVIVAAWACGMRGVSRRGIIAMTVLLGVYFWVRFLSLSVGTPGLDERSSGFLFRMLEPKELEARFGANPVWFYTYNVVTSILSVLFSDPDGGVFETGRAWLQGNVPPRLYLAVASSLMTTGLMAWVVASRLRGRAGQVRDARDRYLIIFAAVLLANSAMSYVYTKHEILSVAGAFYALAAFVAGRHALEWVRRDGPQERTVQPALAGRVAKRPDTRGAARIVVVLVLAATATAWAFRSAGVHHMLRVQAFKVRGDWARVPPEMLRDTGTPEERRAAALVSQLRHDALEMRVTNPNLLPRWADRWWGE